MLSNWRQVRSAPSSLIAASLILYTLTCEAKLQRKWTEIQKYLASGLTTLGQ